MRRARRVFEWMAITGYAAGLGDALARTARRESLPFGELLGLCVAAALALLTLVEGKLGR